MGESFYCCFRVINFFFSVITFPKTREVLYELAVGIYMGESGGPGLPLPLAPVHYKAAGTVPPLDGTAVIKPGIPPSLQDFQATVAREAADPLLQH